MGPSIDAETRRGSRKRTIDCHRTMAQRSIDSRLRRIACEWTRHACIPEATVGYHALLDWPSFSHAADFCSCHSRHRNKTVTDTSIVSHSIAQGPRWQMERALGTARTGVVGTSLPSHVKREPLFMTLGSCMGTLCRLIRGARLPLPARSSNVPTQGARSSVEQSNSVGGPPRASSTRLPFPFSNRTQRLSQSNPNAFPFPPRPRPGQPTLSPDRPDRYR